MTTCAAARRRFSDYLSGILDGRARAETAQHLDSCKACWRGWTRFRWERAEAHPLLNELRTYLKLTGRPFTPWRDSSRELATAWRRTSTTRTSRDDFFRASIAYLYNLVIWEASGNRPDYLAHGKPELAEAAGVIDVGCGIGSDTIALRGAGHLVQPVDYHSPSTDFARWRFVQHGYTDAELRITEPGNPLEGGGAEAIWMIDSLDHVADIDAQLGEHLTHASIVITENPAINRAHGPGSFHIRRSVEAIDEAFAAYGLDPKPSGPDTPIRAWHRAAANNSQDRRPPHFVLST